MISWIWYLSIRIFGMVSSNFVINSILWSFSCCSKRNKESWTGTWISSSWTISSRALEKVLSRLTMVFNRLNWSLIFLNFSRSFSSEDSVVFNDSVSKWVERTINGWFSSWATPAAISPMAANLLECTICKCISLSSSFFFSSSRRVPSFVFNSSPSFSWA